MYHRHPRGGVLVNKWGIAFHRHLHAHRATRRSTSFIIVQHRSVNVQHHHRSRPFYHASAWACPDGGKYRL